MSSNGSMRDGRIDVGCGAYILRLDHRTVDDEL